MCLGNNLYVSGERRTVSVWPGEPEDELYVYTPMSDTWNTMNTPVCAFALLVYKYRLILVGGQSRRNWLCTNKLWTLMAPNTWEETLPPMMMERSWATAVEYSNNILVAGGCVGRQKINISSVEVYNGHHWEEAQGLPIACYDMKSIIFNGHWYLAGGHRQEKAVYYASVESILASCQTSGPFVWKTLADVPDECSNLIVFGNRLVAIDKYSLSLHAYSPYNQSWVQVAGMSATEEVLSIAVYYTGNILMLGRLYLYQVTLNGK